ncbi:hypothetical protein BDQ12DRAFT_697672 [Crucibulum laeve]|uniref:Oxidase ustYa n=1 Tax=Crucibulum laeve TaxID=68775 RepID=A0A5C3M6K2_9AGAR|nr:hypothetical protein BDQ12DRAFT_697672 [Crucibulum laeve]
MVSQNLFSYLLLLASVVNVAIVSTHLFRSHNSPLMREPYSYKGHDFPETLPLDQLTMGQVSLTVEESERYPLLGNDSDANWYSLTSAGWGYTRLGPEDRVFMVTIFHELHCMRMLNFALGDWASTEHVHHCLNYFRQAILCSADLTLEPGDFAERDFAVDRIGSTHSCRDWTSAYDTMEVRWDHWMQVGL